MSRAFVKEDAEIAERHTRRRSASGLPPGALNYMTAEGAERLRARLASLANAPKKNATEIARLQQALSSATIVEPPERPATAVFGSTVSLRAPDGTLTEHKIVGVDELEFHVGAASWISPLGKRLIGTEVGQQVVLEEATKASAIVVKIE